MMDLLVLETNGGRGAEILAGTLLLGRCSDPNEARRIASLIEANDTQIVSRPKGTPTVSVFEGDNGTVDVVIGTKTVVTCPDWQRANELALLLEVDEAKKLRPLTAAYVGVPR